jgi:CAAX protease family protein
MTESTTTMSHRSGRVAGITGRHSMLVFVILACGLSWALVPFTGWPLGVGPTVAAVIVLGVTQGWTGIRALLRQMTKWRVRWTWYAAAIALPAGAAIVAAIVTVALGAPRPTSAQLSSWPEVIPTFLLVLLVPIFGPWEEPGFRGFALSTLSRRRTVLAAALIVGVIHVGWHLPLFFTGDIPAADVVYILAASVVFARLVTGSGGSVLIAMIMHASSNAVSGEFISPMFSGSDADTLGWVRAGIWCVFAVTVIATTPTLRSVPGASRSQPASWRRR